MGQNDEYLEAQVLTASPQQLHLMVIEGAIRFAAQAESALAERDFETAFLSLNKSRDFVSELISGLRSEEPSEMIDRLKDVFVFAYRNLAEADIDHDTGKIAAALDVLRIHRETWLALLNQISGEESSCQAQSSLADGDRQSWLG